MDFCFPDVEASIDRMRADGSMETILTGAVAANIKLCVRACKDHSEFGNGSGLHARTQVFGLFSRFFRFSCMRGNGMTRNVCLVNDFNPIFI